MPDVHTPIDPSSVAVDTLAKLASVAGVLTGALFLSGFQFFGTIFGKFGVQPTMLDLPSYYYLVGGLPAMLVVGGNAFLIILAWRLANLKNKTPWSVGTILVLSGSLLILVLITVTIVGNQIASKWMKSGIDPVQIVFNDSVASRANPLLIAANAKGKLNLLIETKDILVLYHEQGPGVILTYTITRSEVSVIRRIRLNGRPVTINSTGQTSTDR